MKKLNEISLNFLGENDLKILKTEFSDNEWKCLTKNLAYRYEYFNCLDDYEKPVDNLKKEDFLSKLIQDFPTDEETERTKKIIKEFNIKNGEELTRL